MNRYFLTKGIIGIIFICICLVIACQKEGDMSDRWAITEYSDTGVVLKEYEVEGMLTTNENGYTVLDNRYNIVSAYVGRYSIRKVKRP